MPKTDRPKAAKKRVGGATATKPFFIDNRRYPSTEEVGKLLKVPATRVRQLKDLAAKIKSAEAIS